MAASEKQTEEQIRALGARALERLVDDYQKQPSRYSGEIAKDLRQLVELRSKMNASATIGWLTAAVALTPLAVPLATLFVAFNKQLRQTDPHGSTTQSSGHVTKKRGEKDNTESSLRKAIERLQGLSTDYTEAFETVRDMRSAFHQDIAAIIGPRLNEHLKSMPRDSYPEKQELAAWVNAQMRQLGLAIKCPRTGLPGILVADLKQGDSPISRFRLDVRDKTGKKLRTMAVRELPPLELMQADPRDEPLVRWAEKIRRDRTDRSRE